MINIYILDDQPMVLEGIKLLLSSEQDIECIGQALNMEDAETDLKKLNVDILLLDINLGKTSGAIVCEKFSKTFPALKIIALSMHDEPSIIKLMVKKGADGYVLKNAGQGVLVNAIRTIAEGGNFLSENGSKQTEEIFKTYKNQSAFKGSSLSKREKDILNLVHKKANPLEISQTLSISRTAVDFHIKNMISKYNLSSMEELINIKEF